jgi:hypothetical protein
VKAPGLARRVRFDRERVELAEVRDIGLHVDRGSEADIDIRSGELGPLPADHHLHARAKARLLLGAARDRVGRLQVRDLRVPILELPLGLGGLALQRAGFLRRPAAFTVPVTPTAVDDEAAIIAMIAIVVNAAMCYSFPLP